jgi:hypothetical protein
MSSPAYDGKGQPPVSSGWLSGLTAWWDGVKPRYVTAPHSIKQQPISVGHADAPVSAGTLGKPDSSTEQHTHAADSPLATAIARKP